MNYISCPSPQLFAVVARQQQHPAAAMPSTSGFLATWEQKTSKVPPSPASRAVIAQTAAANFSVVSSHASTLGDRSN